MFEFLLWIQPMFECAACIFGFVFAALVIVLGIFVVMGVTESYCGDETFQKSFKMIKRALLASIIILLITLPGANIWESAKRVMIYRGVTSETADRAVDVVDRILDVADQKLDEVKRKLPEDSSIPIDEN